MGRVFVAGSINMDVVATADRHPRVGETVAGKAVLYFPGGKGANQAVAAAKLGAPTTLIGRLGTDAFGQELRAFLAAQGVDLTFVKDTAEAHTGTAIITVANADNTIVVVPGANALVECRRCRARPFWQRATSRSASSKFRCPPSSHSSNGPAPPARPRSSTPRPRSQFGAELLDLVDILILNETELGFLTGTELHDSDDHARFIEAARSLQATGQDRLRDAGQARRAGADRGRAAGRFPAARSRRSTPPAPAIASSARSPRSLPAANPFIDALRLRQRRRLDLRATDGRGAVDADGRGSSAVLSTRRPGERRDP